MKTKYGNAKIGNDGYYHITSRKEGNHMKMLHRLIWEDFYGKSIPGGYDIHHKNGNPLSNEIWNLQCCEHSKHMSFHGKNISDERRLKMSNVLIGNSRAKGHKHNDETKQKISMTNSITKNTTGYYRVIKRKNSKYKQGFIYAYQYYDENKKRKVIQSIDINELEKKVKSKGLKWRVI